MNMGRRQFQRLPARVRRVLAAALSLLVGLLIAGLSAPAVSGP